MGEDEERKKTGCIWLAVAKKNILAMHSDGRSNWQRLRMTLTLPFQSLSLLGPRQVTQSKEYVACPCFLMKIDTNPYRWDSRRKQKHMQKSMLVCYSGRNTDTSYKEVKEFGKYSEAML